MTVERTVVTYPGDTRAWVHQLGRLVHEIRRGRVDVSELLRALDAVHVAATDAERRAQHGYPW